MNPMTTLMRSFRKVRSAVSTNNSGFTFPAQTTTEPTGDGVVSAPSSGWTMQAGWTGNQICLIPFGTGSDGNAFQMKVLGWRRLVVENASDLWIPVPIYSVTCTMGAKVGLAGQSIADTDRYVDTIVALTEYSTAKEIISPADDTIAFLKLDTFGCEKIQVDFNRSTASGANALLAEF